jgi:hypothetical protein
MATIVTRASKGSALTFAEGDANFTNLNTDKLEASGGTITGYKETVFSLGTTSGTVAPDVANGNVQSITLDGNLTLNAFTSPVAGQSITLIVAQDGTGSRTLTSTMKFSGGEKTLTTAANAVDIISVFYDGTNYWASLSKDFK